MPGTQPVTGGSKLNIENMTANMCMSYNILHFILTISSLSINRFVNLVHFTHDEAEAQRSDSPKVTCLVSGRPGT